MKIILFQVINVSFVNAPTLTGEEFYTIFGCDFKSPIKIDVQYTYIMANGKKLNRSTLPINLEEPVLARRRRATSTNFRFQPVALSEYINGKYRCAIYHPRLMSAPVLSSEISVNLKRKYIINYKSSVLTLV